MGWKSFLLKPYAASLSRKIKTAAQQAVKIQEETLLRNIRFAENTLFGKDHDFKNIHSYEDYKKKVPLRSYSEIKPYIEKILKGEENITWPRKPKYIVGTAGTTGGIKHIPLSRESMPYHMKAAIMTGMSYAYRNDLMEIFDGKLIFLTGSPVLTEISGIPTGRLSGIINHEVPNFLKPMQVPSYETNSIKDWNLKMDKIAEETVDLDLRMIGGIPPWIVMYLEKLLELSGKKNVSNIFPNLKMIIHGGVNYRPYHSVLQNLIGKQVDYIETYPATEGFVAFQDGKPEDGLLLNVDGGVFFEYVPAEEIHKESPTRLSLSEVELDKDYALIINNNAGLWSYIIGDLISFCSLDPYRIKMVGRVNQFISAFGEHIVGSDVDEVMSRTLAGGEAIVKEFTVAPQIDEENKKHLWLVEFSKPPSSLEDFEKTLDLEMQKQNFHYKDLVGGNVIQPLKVIPIAEGSFNTYLEKIGKLGGQNKVPRLSNTMHIAHELISLQNKR